VGEHPFGCFHGEFSKLLQSELSELFAVVRLETPPDSVDFIILTQPMMLFPNPFSTTELFCPKTKDFESIKGPVEE